MFIIFWLPHLEVKILETPFHYNTLQYNTITHYNLSNKHGGIMIFLSVSTKFEQFWKKKKEAEFRVQLWYLVTLNCKSVLNEVSGECMSQKNRRKPIYLVKITLFLKIFYHIWMTFCILHSTDSSRKFTWRQHNRTGRGVNMRENMFIPNRRRMLTSQVKTGSVCLKEQLLLYTWFVYEKSDTDQKTILTYHRLVPPTDASTTYLRGIQNEKLICKKLV